MNQLSNIVKDKMVLIINAIRMDAPSGGRTATMQMLSLLEGSIEYKVVDINYAQAFSFYRVDDLLAYFFILLDAIAKALSKATGIVFFEYLLRLNPVFILRAYFAAKQMNPEVIVYNHHSSYIYSAIIKSANNVFVWHDLPSIKKTRAGRFMFDKALCVWLESVIAKNSFHNMFLSFEESRFFLKKYGARVSIFPAVANKAVHGKRKVFAGRYLFVGNWCRYENRNGATLFFDELVRRINIMPINIYCDSVFILAGYQSEKFLAYLLGKNKNMSAIKFKAVSKYSDLDEYSDAIMVAPIVDGAGIKIKTLEAWLHNIPVVGTSQAFSGLPRESSIKGGIICRTIDDIVDLITDPDKLLKLIFHLNPSGAMEEYMRIIEES